MTLANVNLSGMITLVADSDHFTRGITSQILRGFGAKPCEIVDTGEKAMECIVADPFDLVIVEAKLPDMFCGDLIRWLRQLKDSKIRFTPVLVLTSYTQRHSVAAARDAGANLVAKKPVSPRVLYDRISWVARANRPFVETADFMGPDRRFKDTDPPDRIFKRETDVAVDVAASDNQAPLSGAASEVA